MNFKMIAEIMTALDAGKRVAISKNVGTQFYAEYQKINGELYSIQGTEKILQVGFDCNYITEYKIIGEQLETEIEQLEKRLQNIERRLNVIEISIAKFETPLSEVIF